MKTFVISYTYAHLSGGKTVRVNYDAVWKAEGAKAALTEFWKSFDERDAKKVSNVKIYDLVEIQPAED